MSEQEFTARTALVTGGSRGIGRAIAVRLAAGGAAVAVNYIGNEAAAKETQHRIEAAGGRCRTYQADVSDEAAVGAMVSAVEDDLGPVDLLATSAGIVRGEHHSEMTFEGWRRTMAINVDGTFLAVMAVKDGMIDRQFGRIVCLTSVSALRARPRTIAYSASKAAVIGFARSCSEAFAPKVRVNCIAPGLIDTDMVADVPAESRQAFVDATPLGRLGRPDEIAEMAAFLLSERSSFTSGQVMVASGGRITIP